MAKQYQYKHYPVIIKKMQYSGGRVALQFVQSTDFMPVLKATVNLPEVPLEDDEILIKDWGENSGVLAWLQENGIVGPTITTHATGFVYAHKVKLLQTEF